MKNRIVYALLSVLLPGGMASAQIPVEVFAGNKKTTLDVMFFRFFKNKEGANSRFLFFNRNRASIDYSMTKSTSLPQFGFTEAFSYNHKKLGGLAPVVVAQVSGTGVFPKAGLQYAFINKKITLFSWVVSELKNEAGIDFFFLGRYTPAITEKVNAFCQLELVNAFPTAASKSYSFTQRFRLGLKLKEFQFGAAADFSSTGRTRLRTTGNTGGFLRYEF